MRPRNLLIAAVLAPLFAVFVSATPVATPFAHADTQIVWQFPVKGGKVSSGYGPREDGFHGGIDVEALYGSDIVAPAAITITSAGAASGYGTLIEATFDNRPNWTLKVGHCTWESVGRLTTGMQFASGEQFASVGKEGWSTGPHAHFELYIDGVRVNPSEILEGGPGPDTLPDQTVLSPTIIDPFADLVDRAKELIGVN